MGMNAIAKKNIRYTNIWQNIQLSLNDCLVKSSFKRRMKSFNKYFFMNNMINVGIISFKKWENHVFKILGKMPKKGTRGYTRPLTKNCSHSLLFLIERKKGRNILNILIKVLQRSSRRYFILFYKHFFLA